MKFILMDKIESLVPGERIEISKSLSLSEEYLADHFPSFPVLPGVLMLESMTQGAAWLVRLQQNYAKSTVVLKTARNVRYNYFLKPGNTLRSNIKVISIDDDVAKFSAEGYINGRLAVSAKLELACMNHAGRIPCGDKIDARLVEGLKKEFELVGGPAALAAEGCPVA
ncbi:MAG: beta-hydroxyacyl-ACP dehydratase [Phycisphaerae bacterium]|nr:beta-hydroxyacyl-ACP dehydratase [Phycisphaerae bacterium]